ncbi:APH(6) family putative aminoglycoside O-phosphotransferase [Hyphomicrobium methylovorum]|nr:APH(6) family putative aminoglycoside O-phosphotransferase [Hyphomicrobium methylovorum]
MLNEEFERYVREWNLVPDGEAIVTRTAKLLPVLQSQQPAMLRVAMTEEAAEGASMMLWWNGQGAARVFAFDHKALLLERATGSRSLLAMSQGGQDLEATRIICGVLEALHAPRQDALPELTSLDAWFEPLRAAAALNDTLARSAATATRLLNEPRDVVALHGDVHHGNILDFGTRGWLAIDPKGLIGERGFDYANIFCNPDIEWPTPPVAVRKEIFAERIETVAELAGIEPFRLIDWIVAWTGLSASWLIADGDDAKVDLEVLSLALAY